TLMLRLAHVDGRDEGTRQAELLRLRQQVKVLEKKIKRARWQPRDRLVLSALRERLPRSAWSVLLVQPETVLGWHRELVRRRWAAYRRATASWTSTARRGVPGTDSADGEGES